MRAARRACAGATGGHCPTRRRLGDGFDAAGLPDPLAPENLLKSSGRGIFFMRSFMDEVRIEAAAGGGTAVYMIKRFTRS